MLIRTLLEDMHTARIFVQSVYELRKTSRLLGVEPQGYFGKLEGVNGYSLSLYHDLKHDCGGNLLDDIGTMRPFYDLLSAAYGVNLSEYPKQNGYVKYVDYIKELGAGFRVDDTVIKHLREHCNTLIISDKAEFKYLKYRYNRLKRLPNDDEKMAVPARFAALQNIKAR